MVTPLGKTPLEILRGIVTAVHRRKA